MKQVLSSLNIASNHFVHLGRVIGPFRLEFEELSTDEIRILVNWDPKTQAKRYSTKMGSEDTREKVFYKNAYEGFEDNWWFYKCFWYALQPMCCGHTSS